MWATFYDDAAARELKYRCRFWLETLNRYAYIKEVIGPSTVTWTNHSDEAGIFSVEECANLQHQYNTQIEAI